jgi:uncharacterized protein YuzE
MHRVPLVTVDTTTGVFSVDLDVGEVARTVEFDDSHLLDLDDAGRVLSIEVLTPDDPKIKEIAEQHGFVELVPDILAAIEIARAPQITTSTTGTWPDPIQGSVRFTGNALVGTRPAVVVPPPQERELTLK